MIVQPGPLMDFLIANQNARDPQGVDWAKAKRTLKNLRITAQPTNMEFKITGLSDKTCREQTFELRQKNSNGEYEAVEVTVYDYFVKHRKIDLRYSADLPCINVGKPRRPTFIPVELCTLVSLQRYTKSLSGLQRASLVEKSRQKPRERMTALIEALRTSDYGSDPLPRSSGIAINTQFAGVGGRVLTAPKLRCGNGQDFFPQRGRWNFNNKTLYQTNLLENLIIVNFSARVDMNKAIPLVSGVPTIIIGMDVSHGSPGRADVPSIAAVVSSRGWPSISRYRAAVRTQSPKVEIIDDLFKPVPGTTDQDEGMIRELLLDFYNSSGRKPEHIIIFRDGVGETQFCQVLNKELDQIVQACKCLEENWSPKFSLIVAQKNHHTKFFQERSPDNVPPGTVVDNSICHPKNNDFYMCSQAGMILSIQNNNFHFFMNSSNNCSMFFC